ncbi:potassium-transporting ATPase subunit KdpC [Novosphingobium sp. 1949]|uniref:Potassium-transporting ATPase KdpC subunit n=1 Tax=Novosphingobium organovorum TaxID=2930092 RepID=A0ABT0BI55_9SPHN|nr:potassium-transporting ATPase subunit KdpC [Novosphingobium organovorum]MCJ2184409.1 potassium-transporting ATPase subunit KdpC [Novosphingobium organovorum]
MKNDILSSLRPALVMTVLFALLLGLAYPLAMTGLGQTLFPVQADGSLVRANGTVIGSRLVGQAFTASGYFHPRPSAPGEGYDGLASGGSNLGPASKALHQRVAGQVAALEQAQPGQPIPVDLVTASGSGLDPDISPEAARYQVARVAKARAMNPALVRGLVEAAIERPLLGFIGEAHVNVFELNRRLDALPAKPAA